MIELGFLSVYHVRAAEKRRVYQVPALLARSLTTILYLLLAITYILAYLIALSGNGTRFLICLSCSITAEWTSTRHSSKL